MEKNGALLENKWNQFLRLARLFSFIPFIDFVLAAGSLAQGTVHENSDFDVIVGVKNGRIFTVRFFAMGIFSLFGARRGRKDRERRARNKVCLNHFVTSARYMLSPPYHAQWKRLYASLVPIWGEKKKIEDFFHANESWLGAAPVPRWDRFRAKKPNVFRGTMEFLLSGFLGNAIERAVKSVQVWKIKKNMPSELGFRPRLRYNDEEIELHPDTEKFWKSSLRITN